MSSSDILEESGRNHTENHEDAAMKKNRVSTDGNYFLLHFLFLCGLGALLTYCISNGDLYRITEGYDNWKNVCGMKNLIQEDLRISDQEALDMRLRPYLLTFKPHGQNTYNVTYTRFQALDVAVIQSLSSDVARVCVTDCKMYPNHEPFRKRCVLKKRKGVSERFFGKTGIPNFFVEVAEDLALNWEKIMYLGIGCAVLSFILTILFGLLTGVMVWLILNAAALLCLAFTIYMWFLFVGSKQAIDHSEYLPSELELERNRTYLAFALIGTFVVPLFIFIILTNRRRMEMIIELYKETIKVVTAMRLLILLPVLTCVFVFATVSAWIYATLWIESSGKEKMVKVDFFLYLKDPWILAARWYNTIASLWMLLFFLHCQHMVIAGAVSFWYFCRNKGDLGIPIFYGFYILVAHHLGSVSLGSLITLLVGIPRMILMLIQIFFNAKEEQFVAWRENVLKYFSRDAYVEVVIYGYPFRPAGRQAFKALTANDLGVTSVKKMCTFVLIFANILVCTVTVLTGAIILQEEQDLLHMWAVLILIGIFAYLIATCFFSLYQAIIDTIFLCFCEDYRHNDGLSQPYFASQAFFELVENSKKLLVGSSTHE